MQITVPRAAMRALMHLALQPAKKSEKNPDKRDYLRGIYLEVACDEVRMVATDGNVMGVFRSTAVAPKGIEPGETRKIIVPLDTVRKLKPITSRREERGRQYVRIHGAANGTEYALVDAADTYYFTPVDGGYPDYRRPFPTGPLDGEAATYDPALLMKFADAACEFNGGEPSAVRVRSQAQENGPGLVQLAVHHHFAADNFIGLIMPLKVDITFSRPPSWVKETYGERELARFMELNKEAA